MLTEREVPRGLILRILPLTQIQANSSLFRPCCSQNPAHSVSITSHIRSGNTLLGLCSDTVTPLGVTWHIQSLGCFKDTWFCDSVVTLNHPRRDNKEENPSLWPQAMLKSPESGSEGRLSFRGRENYCLPQSTPIGQWFSTLAGASESLGEL